MRCWCASFCEIPKFRPPRSGGKFREIQALVHKNSPHMHEITKFRADLRPAPYLALASALAQVFLKSHSFIHFLDTHVGITEPKSQVHLRKSRVVRQSCAAQRAAHKIYEFVQNFTPRAQKICEIISHLLHEILAWAKLVGDPDDDEARGDGGGRASGE